jgi:CheY-like chemotaxis protein
VLTAEPPVCPVCLHAITPHDVVSGSRDSLMHQRCDHARARANPGSGVEAKLVLVVDDDDDQRATYAMVVEAAGYRVVEAAHGLSAIARAIALRPNLILLDLSMPGLDGIQTCRWLKATQETSGIPVVILTGHAVEQAEREAIDAGCDRFLIKGSHPEPVIQAIREFLAA